jgi:hypothetical protein
VKPVLLVQLGSTLFMVGLIWFVQIVHYPLFAAVPESASAAYERAHTERTTWVVIVPMLIELGSAVWLAALSGEDRALRYLGVGLVGLVWASTFLLQVPMHERLSSGFEASAHARLVLTNWIRTVAWTARGALVLYLLNKALR